MAAAAKRPECKPFLPRRLTGTVFLLGFALLGVAISHWHFQECNRSDADCQRLESKRETLPSLQGQHQAGRVSP
jgi:hypothetical protein